MSSESDRQLSMEELRRRNMQRPPETVHPTTEEWQELTVALTAMGKILAEQMLLLEEISAKPSPWTTKEQTAELIRETKEIHRLLEQAGKKKEKHSCKWLDWLPDFDLIVVAKWIVLVLLIVAALLGMGYGTATVVSNIRNLFL